MSDEQENRGARGMSPARRYWRGRALGALLLGGLAVGNADCAQERDPIDRVRALLGKSRSCVGRTCS